MRTQRTRVAFLALAAVSLTSLVSCVDEKIVYRDRELFEEVPSAAANFVGYTDHTTKLTVCGNCHIEKQGDWAQTQHAAAWAGLQSSSAAQGFCEGCHTISENGNAAEGDVGYTATRDQRYEDVQCESCHGPGLTHVTNPTDETVPLASMIVSATASCGECHSDTHHPFVEEWEASRHGGGAHRPQYRTRDGCSYCHGGEAALKAWGVNTEYLEKGQGLGQEIGVTCVVCHDPHSKDNPHQLRYRLDARNIEENLCMKCHHKRAVPEIYDGGWSRGPHSPQGQLLLGEIGTVGWTPPGFTWNASSITATHGSEANEELCATCHVNDFEVTDAASGDHLFSATGHLFDPVPCVDAQGIPLGDSSCDYTTEARTFQSCTSAGCHGTEAAALSAMLLARARIEGLVAELDALFELVPAAEFSREDGVFTVAEGAQFNQSLGEIESSAIHNPFLTEALLTASIKIVKSTYGLTAQSAVVTDNILWDLSITKN